MSAATAAKPAANPRQPLSLRELFCLTTLAAMTVALVLYREWSTEERWLLGLALGGTLLGILVARMCGRRGWIGGSVVGILGSLVFIGLIALDWWTIFHEHKSDGWEADRLLEEQADYLWCGAVTSALVLLLMLAAVCCFQFARWSTDGGEQGLMQVVRRRPRFTTMVLVSIGVFAPAVWNFEFLAAPRAWRPTHFIPAEDFPADIGRSWSGVRHGALSQNGQWLIVDVFHDSVPDSGSAKLFRLDPVPHAVSRLVADGGRQPFYAFDCQSERLAYVKYDKVCAIRIVDLTTLEDTCLQSIRSDQVSSLQWLVDGSIVVHYDEGLDGSTAGFTRIPPLGGYWSRKESSVNAKFDSHSGLSLVRDGEGVKLVDEKSSRTIELFSQQWLESMMPYETNKRLQLLRVSPNGRFILSETRIYDRELGRSPDWLPHERALLPDLHEFTRHGEVICSDGANSRGWDWMRRSLDVPFCLRLLSWLERDPVRIIDPLTGSELARTYSLESSPRNVLLSHDGSRMAVFSYEGVYIYDVPAEFR